MIVSLSRSRPNLENAADIERTIESFARVPNGGLVLPPDATTTGYRDLIIALAARHRLPAVYTVRAFVEEGGLMSYGADRADMFRQAAGYIERILRGAKHDLAGGSSGRTAGAVFYNAHLPYKLPCANRAEKDGVAIEVLEYVDGTAEEAKHTVRRISLSEEDMPFGEVRANHCGPLNWQQVADPGKLACSHRLAWTPTRTRTISTGSTFAIRGIPPD
jgi:ABC transporter substrate binding protein